MTNEASGSENTTEPGIYLQQRIDHWEFALMTASPFELDETAAEALDELNFLWQHDGQLFAFEGRGIYPIQVEGQHPVPTDGVWSSKGMSRGFTILDVKKDGDYRLYHEFLVGIDIEHPSVVEKRSVELTAYMNTNVSLVLSEELEEAVTPRLEPGSPQIVDPYECGQGLIAASEELTKMLGSIAFQSLPVNKQRKIVSRFVKECEQNYDLRNMGAVLETQYCYRPIAVPREKGSPRLFEQVSISDSIVTGTLMAYGAVEHAGLIPGRRRTNREVFYKDAGLCLIMAVKQAAEPATLKAADVIWVPTGNQEVGISYTHASGLPDISALLDGPGEPGEPIGA